MCVRTSSEKTRTVDYRGTIPVNERLRRDGCSYSPSSKDKDERISSEVTLEMFASRLTHRSKRREHSDVVDSTAPSSPRARTSALGWSAAGALWLPGTCWTRASGWKTEEPVGGNRPHSMHKAGPQAAADWRPAL